MDIRDLELSRPCPIDLDSLGVDRSQRQVFCSHCSSQVTDISKMVEADAAAFVAANRGKGVCISYTRDGEGNVHFAEMVDETDPSATSATLNKARADGSAAGGWVPVERLSRPRPRPRLRHAAAVAAIALAACTPHAEHDNSAAERVDEIMMQRSEPEIPIVLAEEVAEGSEEEVVEVVEVVDRLRLEDVDLPELPKAGDEEPCEGKTDAALPRVRGRIKPKAPAKPKTKPHSDKLDLSVVDGGI